MYIITKINNGFKKVQNYIRCSLRRKKLRNKDFTIINQDLKFISFSESKNYDLIKGDREYPIARLDDIEIYFMHYKTKKEAKEKWYRRCKRINYDSLIFKVSQREGFTKQDMEEFMDIENKMLEGDETELLQKYFDDLDYLNNI